MTLTRLAFLLAKKHAEKRGLGAKPSLRDWAQTAWCLWCIRGTTLMEILREGRE